MSQAKVLNTLKGKKVVTGSAGFSYTIDRDMDDDALFEMVLDDLEQMFQNGNLPELVSSIVDSFEEVEDENILEIS